MTDHDIINLRSADPFADVTGLSAVDSGVTAGSSGPRSSHIIHIRIQQRSGKKTLTTVQVSCTLAQRAALRYPIVRRALAKSSIRNVFCARLKSNLPVMVLLSNIKNTARSFNFKVTNARTSASSSRRSASAKLSS